MTYMLDVSCTISAGINMLQNVPKYR